MNKVLVITYYWPPAGGISVQRVAKFCKYLSDFNWKPIILTVADGNYLYKDDSYHNDIKYVQKVYRAGSIEPHWFYNKFNKNNTSTNPDRTTTKAGRGFDWFSDFIRLNLFLPDSRIGWYPNAVTTGLRIIEQEKPVLLFSTAPPFTCHLIAKKLHIKSGLPWVADFRDAWLENNLYDKPYRLTPARLLNKRMEKSVLNTANKVVCIGENMKQLLSSKLPSQTRAKFQVIMNGYDGMDISPNANGASDFFFVSYFGTLYKERIPVNLLAAIKVALDQHGSLNEKLRFRIFGNIDHTSLKILRKYIPDKNLLVSKTISYKEFMHELQTPQILLLTIDNVPHNELIVTGKIFDYLTSGNPIIGIGPLNGDAARLLQETNKGEMFDYNNTQITDYILHKYQLWQDGKLKEHVTRLSHLERKQLTGKLAELFNETVRKS